jgi:hypothetical protein
MLTQLSVSIKTSETVVTSLLLYMSSIVNSAAMIVLYKLTTNLFNILHFLCNCIVFTKNQYQFVALYYLFVG